MATSLRTSILSAAILLVAVVSAHGQSPYKLAEATSQNSSLGYAAEVNYYTQQDLLYDWQVFAASWETNWYVVATYKNGQVSESKHSTQQAADQFAAWLLFHIAEISSVKVEDRVELGPFEFVATFDKRADAESLAETLESLGLVTDIRRYSRVLVPSGDTLLLGGFRKR